jgi:hypothetical protein
MTVHSGRRAVDFYVRNGFSHHRRLLLWEPTGSSAAVADQGEGAATPTLDRHDCLGDGDQHDQ